MFSSILYKYGTVKTLNASFEARKNRLTGTVYILSSWFEKWTECRKDSAIKWWFE